MHQLSMTSVRHFFLFFRAYHHPGALITVVSRSEQLSLEPAFCGVSRVERQYFTVTPGCLAAEMSCQQLQMQSRKLSHVRGP